MRSQQRNIQNILWGLAGLTFLLSGLMTFINLNEFVKIGLLHQTTDYPFGGEGPTPWYYKTADLYAKVNLVFGLAFFSTIVAAIWTAFKRNKMGLYIVLLSAMLLFLIKYITGQIELSHAYVLQSKSSGMGFIF